jgi:hypothetical protein
MFDSISNSWSILTQSWSVLRKNKELTLFPILSGIASLLVAATFVLPFILVPEWGKQVMAWGDRAQHGGQQPGIEAGRVVLFVLMFLFYVVSYFVMIFFNVALVSCALVRMSGGEPTFRDGLSAAGSRLPQIFAWAVVAGTVGMILKVIEQKSDAIGRFVVGLLGLAWTVTTYLVVPILAVEGLGPMAALKRSAELLRRCWGEGLAGNFTMGFLGFLFCLPGVLLIFLGILMLGPLGWGAAFFFAGGLIYLLAAAIIMSSLHQIYLAGVYIFAAQQRVVDGFDEDLLRSAFRRKRR